MASVDTILRCCVVLAHFLLCRGLDFSMTRTADGQFCGHLKCLVDTDQNDPSIFSIVGISIYDVTQASNKEKVAAVSVTPTSPGLYVDPDRQASMKASGSVTRYQANLTIDLESKPDCQKTRFLCELDFISLTGQLSSLQKLLAPSSNNCSLANCALARTFDDLNGRASKIQQELDQLGHLFDDLESRLNSYLGGNPQTNPTNRPETTPTAITTPPTVSVSSCTRGMAHSKPRETIELNGNKVLCDTETDGGGWLVIQRRVKGDVDFYKNWDDYKNGFGTPDTDYWLGNELIHALAAQGYTELRVDLEHETTKVYAHYTSFTVGDEGSNYRLTVGGYSGTAGDSLSYHNDMSFTTPDSDHDTEEYFNCGQEFHGAWWYRDCFESNLNGQWGQDGATACSWNQFLPEKALSFSEIKIRHV